MELYNRAEKINQNISSLCVRGHSREVGANQHGSSDLSYLFLPPWKTHPQQSFLHLTMRIRLALGTLLCTSTLALLPSVKAQLDEKDGWLNLTIIHTNDIHSRVEPANTLGTSCTAADKARGNCYGGAARHKTLIERLRQGKKHSLLLDGGDEFQVGGKEW